VSPPGLNFSMQIDLCSMTHAPTPIGPLIGMFAVFVAVAAAAGVLRRSRARGARVSAIVLINTVVGADLLLSMYISRTGILADAATCTPLEGRTTWGILVGLNLAVLAAWHGAYRIGVGSARVA
jgi:hypothetical protein